MSIPTRHRPKGYTTNREADVLYVVASRSEAGEATTAQDIADSLGVSLTQAGTLLRKLMFQHRLVEQRTYSITSTGTEAIGRVMVR